MKAAIFFFAHAGISRVYQWLHWHMGCPEVALRVFCPPQTILPEIFVKLPFFYETCWGSPQLVYVQQEAYKCILNEFPDLGMIFMVSGSDIPVASIDSLLEISNQGQSYLPFTRSGIGGHARRRDKLPFIDTTMIGMKPPSYQTLQWVHLTRKHAQKIAEFPLWKLQYIHTHLQYACNLYGKCMPVADEYWVWTILSQESIDDICDRSLTEMDRESPTSSSPITWSSNEETRRVLILSGKDGDIYDTITLSDALRYAQTHGALFYRKVEFV
jgi:hypothetical protein